MPGSEVYEKVPGDQSPVIRPHNGAGGHFITTQLQLDLASAIARLEQIRDQDVHTTLGSFLLDRVLTCDLPRLRGHLQPEMEAFLQRIQESSHAS